MRPSANDSPYARAFRRRAWRWLGALAGLLAALPAASFAVDAPPAVPWVGSWAAVQQPPMPGSLQTLQAQTLRLIVHASLGGSRVRIRLSNRDGDTPLAIDAAHIALRTQGADIDAASDRTLRFHRATGVRIPPHGSVLSDPVALTIPAQSELAVSLYLPGQAPLSTVHILAQQTSYVSTPGDASASAHFPVARRIDSWPFLANVDVQAPPPAFAIVLFGDSMVDGDGATPDANQRWSDALATRLHQQGVPAGVLNAGLIGNRLLRDSPGVPPFGAALGEAGVTRFGSDALDQPGVRLVIVRLGGNDLGFMDALAPAGERVDAAALIAGYQRLATQAHQRGLRIVASTVPPFEGVTAIAGYATPAKEAVRQQVNAWLRQGQAFDALIDVDQLLRDPAHPSRLRPAYDSGDHLHPNDQGYRVMAAALPVATLLRLAGR